MSMMVIGFALIVVGAVFAKQGMPLIPYLLIGLGFVFFLVGRLGSSGKKTKKRRQKPAQGKVLSENSELNEEVQRMIKEMLEQYAAQGKTLSGNSVIKTEVQKKETGKAAGSSAKKPEQQVKQTQQGKTVNKTTAQTQVQQGKTAGKTTAQTDGWAKVGPFFENEVCAEKLTLYGLPVRKGELKDGTEWEVMRSNFGLCLVLVGSGAVTDAIGKPFDVDTNTQLYIVQHSVDPWDLSDELNNKRSGSLVDSSEISAAKLKLENLAVDERITYLPASIQCDSRFKRHFVLTVVEMSDTRKRDEEIRREAIREIVKFGSTDVAKTTEVAKKTESPTEVELRQREVAKAALRQLAGQLPQGLPTPGEYIDGGHYKADRGKDAEDWYWVLDSQDTLWLLGRGEVPTFRFTGYGCSGLGEDTEDYSLPWLVSEAQRLKEGSDWLVSYSLFDMRLTEISTFIRTLVLSPEAQLPEEAHNLTFLLGYSKARTILLPASMQESIEKDFFFTHEKELLARIRYY